MRKNKLMKWVTGFAMAGVLLAGMAGLTQSTAMAKEDNSVGAVKVETVKTYKEKTKTKDAKIEVPQIKTEKKSTGAEKINKEIKNYTDKVIKEFKKDLKKEGYKSVNVSYKVMTNNKDMFTLRLETTEVMASSAVSYQFYHLDKKADKVITLKDMFKKNADYVKVISNDIKKQMREEMKNGKTYFLDSKEDGIKNLNFKSIKKNQNFYVDGKGNLVICFDKYEVAPGSEGCPTFTIAKAKLANILK